MESTPRDGPTGSDETTEKLRRKMSCLPVSYLGVVVAAKTAGDGRREARLNSLVSETQAQM